MKDYIHSQRFTQGIPSSRDVSFMLEDVADICIQGIKGQLQRVGGRVDFSKYDTKRDLGDLLFHIREFSELTLIEDEEVATVYNHQNPQDLSMLFVLEEITIYHLFDILKALESVKQSKN